MRWEAGDVGPPWTQAGTHLTTLVVLMHPVVQMYMVPTLVHDFSPDVLGAKVGCKGGPGRKSVDSYPRWMT